MHFSSRQKSADDMLIVFDLDDTLYPESDYVRSGFEAVDSWVRNRFGVEGFASCAQTEFGTGNRTHVFDAVLEKLGLDTSAQTVSELVDVYRTHEPRLVLWDDADQAMNVLSYKYDLALVTDGYLAAQRRKVRSLGLDSRLNPIVFSDELGGRSSWKPSSIPYRRMMEITGAAPEICVYIADNPFKDFVTARKLGWSTIRIRRPEQLHWTVSPANDYGADIEISSMLVLPALIDGFAKTRMAI